MYILIANQKTVRLGDILPVLEQVIQAGKPLLIVGSRTSRASRSRRSSSTSCAHVPGRRRQGARFGDRRKRMLEDIAILSGGEVITEELGLKLENTKLSQLGHARKVVVDSKDTTTLIDGAGDSEAIKGRIKQLKQEDENIDSDFMTARSPYAREAQARRGGQGRRRRQRDRDSEKKHRRRGRCRLPVRPSRGGTCRAASRS